MVQAKLVKGVWETGIWGWLRVMDGFGMNCIKGWWTDGGAFQYPWPQRVFLNVPSVCEHDDHKL